MVYGWERVQKELDRVMHLRERNAEIKQAATVPRSGRMRSHDGRIVIARTDVSIRA